ncbi:MAG: hypothetical protein WC710_13520 [Gallionella sp.]|jgi:hypothetical protein
MTHAIKSTPAQIRQHQECRRARISSFIIRNRLRDYQVGVRAGVLTMAPAVYCKRGL